MCIMKRTVTLLPPEQFNALRALSLKTGMPAGEIVRRALAEYFKKQRGNQ
jgi:predicted DNA-binding protein